MRPDKSLTPFEIRLYKHYRVVHGCRIALAFVLTFVLVAGDAVYGDLAATRLAALAHPDGELRDGI